MPFVIWVTVSDSTCEQAAALVQETQRHLETSHSFTIIQERLRLVKAGGKDCATDSTFKEIQPALYLELNQAGADFTFQVHHDRPAVTVGSSFSELPPKLAGFLNSLLLEEKIAAANVLDALASNRGEAQAFLASVPQDVRAKLENKAGRAFKSAPAYHLTLSLFTAGGAPSGWDIQSALRAHIEPLVHALSSVAAFDITSQIQLYSSFTPSIQPRRHDGTEGSQLSQDDLTTFVNAAEWPLSPSIGSGPTINLVLYVPSKDQIPLTIEALEATSWLIPQWGGIKILNPPLVTKPDTGAQVLPIHLDEAMLTESFESFSEQLLSLVGVPALEFQGSLLPLAMRVDAFKRLTALSLHLKGSASLGSLARLAEHLSNIPIPRHVAQLVDDTIANLGSCKALTQEAKYNQALFHARMAYEDSEKAFFDKSMVGMVYFPEEHKVAVYLPLLGPIGVPLFIGLLREIKRLSNSFKKSNVA